MSRAYSQTRATAAALDAMPIVPPTRGAIVLWLARRDVAQLADALEAIQVRARRAGRHLTHATSATGQAAHRAVHEIDRLCDAALAITRGAP